MRSDGGASGRNEVVVVVLVLPVKMDLSRALAHVDSFVIRSVYDHSAGVPPGKNVGVLTVSPFAVCPQRISEIARIGAAEIVVGIVDAQESGEIAKEVCFNRTIVRPTNAVSHAMKQAIPIPWDTTQPEAFTCDMVHDVLQITRRLCGTGILRFSDTAVARPQPLVRRVGVKGATQTGRYRASP